MGFYNLPNGIDAAAKVTIRGVNGRPRLLFANTGLFLGFAGSLAKDLYIETAGDYALSVVDSKVDQVTTKATGGGGVGCQMTNSTITNAICWSVGSGSEGVEVTSDPARGVTDTLRGVTALAQGPNSDAVKVEALTSQQQTVRLTNVIARGTSSDIETQGGPTAGNVTVNVDHSNWANRSAGPNAPINDMGANQTAPPVFLAADNPREAASSPTVDKGANHPDNGSLDFEGTQRTLGAGTDIGADELIPPPKPEEPNQPPPPPPPLPPGAETLGATGITATAANVTGLVNPSGSASSYRFEFGTTTAYGASTAATNAGAANGNQAVGALLTGLTPGTVYHYRVVASNAGGTSLGLDREFKTAPDCPAPPVRSAASVVGTLLGERLLGTSRNDTLSGLAGDDCVYGLGGNDLASGGSGDDTVVGDTVPPRTPFSPRSQRPGTDRLSGGTGDDDLRGNSLTDLLSGGTGADFVSGGTGNDRVDGGTGDDRLTGATGNDLVSGGSGDDVVLGSAGNDRLSPGTGRDSVDGGMGNDRIIARDLTRDRIDCGGGRDTVAADRGDQIARNCERVTFRGG
jgi:Ca2+-binding RTX toxin-like protein